jgi:hypothetical protein
MPGLTVEGNTDEVEDEVEDEEVNPAWNVASPRTDSESGATWESGSEFTSVVSGSSVWTDNSHNPDRSSRRALILQMAKARMKGNKTGGSIAGESAIAEEAYEDVEEEKKLDYHRDQDPSTDNIDFTEDLD